MVYDEECESQNTQVILQLGKTLSFMLRRDVTASLNHDDDQLQLWVFRAGKIIDEYNSSPGLWGDSSEVQGGNPQILAAAFGTQDAQSLERILQSNDYAFAHERHIAIAELAGVDGAFFACGAVSLARRDIEATVLDRSVRI
jgi:hypothetical protein